MMTKWPEYSYPSDESKRREDNGSDRCGSAGFRDVKDIADLTTAGVILDQPGGVPLTTPNLKTPGVWIFAVREGSLRCAADGGTRWVPGALSLDGIKHETLFQNKPVNAAGEIAIKNGVVVDLNSDSGTYNNDIRDENVKGAIRAALQNAGAPFDGAAKRKLS